MIKLATSCRLSGESLADAEVLFDISDCPLPGIYPTSISESISLHSPLRVIQSRQSGFVQLAHVLGDALYRQYAFAGGKSGTYRRYLETFADDIVRTFPKSTSVLEVGCGDGWLLGRLLELGFTDVLGIDPSRAADSKTKNYLISGCFPKDIPASHQNRKFDLIILRHVLEHIETPRPFIAALAAALSSNGQLWIEVPDLESTLERNLWSNFYQLHCNYFSAATLDQMVATAGLRCVTGKVVDIFGGSLLRKYVHGVAPTLPPPPRLSGIEARVKTFCDQLSNLVSRLPAGTVGYGAAERTAVTLGMAPDLSRSLICLYDGNPLLAGCYLAGTRLPIYGKEMLFEQPPSAILIFAISNAAEILNEWHTRLPEDILVGVVGGDFLLKPLKEFK